MAEANNNGNLEGIRKAAALLIALGTDACAKIFKVMENDEVEKLAIEMSKIQELDYQTSEKIVEEFHALLNSRALPNPGGITYVTAALSKAIGAEDAVETINRIQEHMSTKPFEQLMNSTSSDLIAEMLRDEHPQTIALILCHVKEQKAAEILSALPRDIQTDVIIRIANMKTVSPEIVSEIENSLREKSKGHEMISAGGMRAAANILNYADVDVEKGIIESITKVDPDLAEQISNLMFTYDDLVLISDMGIQRLLQAVDENDLLLALKASPEEVKAKLLKNMSERRRQSIMEDLSMMPPVRLRDVQAAQGRILLIAKELIQSGVIEVIRDSSSEVFV